MPPRREDLSGQRFGKLTVVEPAPSNTRFTHWLCQCDCGRSVVTRSNNLKTNNTKSCGCMKRRELPPVRKLDPVVEMLRDTRREKNISISDMANQIGYARQSLSQVERGQHDPSLNFLRCWAQALGMTINLEKDNV